MTATIRTALGFLALGAVLATGVAQAQNYGYGSDPLYYRHAAYYQNYQAGYYDGCNCAVPQTQVVVTTRYLPPPVVRTASPPLLMQAVPATGASTTVHFAFDRSNLDAEDRARLDQVVASGGGLAQVEGYRVVGHTDSIGTRRYNQGLSMRRANATAGYLNNRGIPASQIGVAGAGELQPVASNRTARGRALNRRAEVTAEGYALVPPKPMVRYPVYQGIR